LESEKYNWRILCPPGAKRFNKLRINHTGVADSAILMVSAQEWISQSQNELKILTQQFSDHAYLAFANSLDKIVVLVNKMDHESVQFREEVFKVIKKKFRIFCKSWDTIQKKFP
jgi:translation elongation factor EF-1alpha